MTKQAEDFIDEQFADMSDEEALEFIRNLRKRRATPKEKPAKKKAKKKAKSTFVTNFQKLTKEEKAALLKELMG